jgi:uncharacterized repeat protein (TIGR01451 family)
MRNLKRKVGSETTRNDTWAALSGSSATASLAMHAKAFTSLFSQSKSYRIINIIAKVLRDIRLAIAPKNSSASIFATILTLGLFVPSLANAQVVWEDYQGNSRVTGTSGQDYPGSFFTNGSGTDAQIISSLKAVSANAANASRTGTSASIDFSAASMTLCNLDPGYDPAGTGAACQFDVQGRVLWTVVKYPVAGTYSFSLAHDDQVDIDMSTDYSSTNYKNAVYDLPVGALASYTGSDTSYENVAATFVAPAANHCALVRMYWANAGGINHLRFRWTKPGGVTEIIPTAQLYTPGQTAAALGCAGAVSTSQTSVLVNKVVGATGRANSADQFTIDIANGATSIGTATTSGSGTGQQASTAAQVVSVGTTYTITDAMAAGSSSALSAYTPTIACTRNGTAFTPGGSVANWTVSATAVNQAIVCNITNTRKTATLQLRKQWVNAIVTDAATIPATTGFTANTTVLNAVADTSSEIDTGTAITVQVGESGVLKAETITVGYPVSYTKALSCTGATPSGTNAAADNTLTIPATAGGMTIVCTYLNTHIPTAELLVTKTNGSTGVFKGSTTTYTITVTNNGPNSATGAIVTDVPVSGLTCPTTNTVTVSSGGSFTVADLFGAGITLGTLPNGQSVTLTYSCTVN